MGYGLPVVAVCLMLVCVYKCLWVCLCVLRVGHVCGVRVFAYLCLSFCLSACLPAWLAAWQAGWLSVCARAVGCERERERGRLTKTREKEERTRRAILCSNSEKKLAA